ncbi:carbohydrate kinase family protein [Paenibacillus sp. FSL K6-3182]|uniref:carbohydrate kinase family protein n=1 Tax=Paenibacillus sp. FSL K6-3182 TaxID=2921495 RepID=UPI0030CCA5FE
MRLRAVIAYSLRRWNRICPGKRFRSIGGSKLSSATVSLPVIVGGHICLDIIPSIPNGGFSMVPGKLLNIGKAVLSTGGAVANTGLALQRLGMPVKLMGKIGNDIFGNAILSMLREVEYSLADGMIIANGESTSYSIVLSPPHVDRMFLHSTGANDTFEASDIPIEALEEASLFHFGYPPLMRRMCENGGAEIIQLMKRAKEAGVTTSLDMAKPDPEGDTGKLDWRPILSKLLPFVDLFLPSIEEILYMLRRDQYEELKRKRGSEQLVDHIDADMLQDLSSELLAMGAAVVVLKLGEHGLYMRSTAQESRLNGAGRYCPLHVGEWLDRELYIPCFQVEVAGTTGAGDCTIAGFLAAFIQGLKPEETLIAAAGTGACNVEQPDATSGIPTWGQVQSRIAFDWKQHKPIIQLPGFHEYPYNQITLYARI